MKRDTDKRDKVAERMIIFSESRHKYVFISQQRNQTHQTLRLEEVKNKNHNKNQKIKK
jgi:hypothetical protein